MSGPAIGLRTAFGFAKESTYGTFVAATDWLEVVSESLERRQRTINSAGLRGGLRAPQRSARRVLTSHDAGGDVNLEVPVAGFGPILEQLLGGIPTSAQQESTAAYLHTFEMDEIYGKSLSLQKIIRDATGGDVQAFSYPGAKITAAEFSIAVDQILTARLTFDCQQEDPEEAAGTPSYATDAVYHFKQGALKLGGTEVASAMSASVAITNNLKTDRYFLGSAGLKAEPADNGWPAVSGSFTMEFEDPSEVYEVFAADAGLSLVLEFVGDNIEDTYDETFRITVPVVHLEGETPKVGGPDLIVPNIPFVGLWDGTNAAVKIEVISTDTSV